MQRGAVGLFGVLVFGLALLFVVLAVDTGRLALEKRRLQLIADLAAIDALQAGLCSGAESADAEAVAAAAQASALRNGYSGDLTAEAGAVLTGDVTTDVGGIRQFVPAGPAIASAVQVTASREVTSSLVAGGWNGGTIRLSTVAVAQRLPLAGFEVGSFLLSVDSADATLLNGLFGGLLGATVSLDALSYEGLAAAELTLEQIISGAELAGIGLTADGVEGLLASQLSVADLLMVTATALDAQGDSTAAAAVNELQAAAPALGTIRIGELLVVSGEDPEAALQSSVNAYALGSAAIQLGREGQTMTMPVAAALPLGLGSANVSLHVVEAPQIAVGPPGRDSDGNWWTSAHNAQFRLQVDVPVSVPLLGGAITATGQVSLAAEAARSDAWLAGIRCAGAGRPAHRVDIGVQPGVARFALGRFTDITDPGATVEAAPALQISSTPLAQSASVIVGMVADMHGGTAQTLNFDVTAEALPPPQTAGMPVGSALHNATDTLADSLVLETDPATGLPLVGATAEMLEEEVATTLLQPLLTALDEAVLEPLFLGLGLNLGGADIQLLSLDADESRLVR
jgi:uncharacterized membrane protein